MTEHTPFLRDQQPTTCINLARFCNKRNQLPFAFELDIIRTCLQVIQFVHQQNKLCLNIHAKQFYIDLGTGVVYLANSGLIVKRNLFGHYRASHLIGDYLAPELISQYWAYEQCMYTVQTDVYALGKMFACMLHLDLDLLRQQRMAHPNILFFDFALKEHYLRGKDNIALRVQMIKFLLTMTDDDPRRRPSISGLLQSVAHLLQQVTNDAQSSFRLACK